MGTLHYGSTPFEVDDDTLRHFAVVAIAKLRRQEPFLVLVHVDDDGLERLWLHPAVDLRIATDRSSAPLDPARVEHMMREANAPSGLDLAAPWHVPEPAKRR
ncbi:DUF7882 family protein [Burkholderia cenocepacia]|uniref:DUF7882 family protein n=1 Tax=Burkholderia cenocepacia TaxID=95486 RepID=UPI0038CBFF7E